MDKLKSTAFQVINTNNQLRVNNALFSAPLTNFFKRDMIRYFDVKSIIRKKSISEAPDFRI